MTCIWQSCECLSHLVMISTELPCLGRLVKSNCLLSIETSYKNTGCTHVVTQIKTICMFASNKKDWLWHPQPYTSLKIVANSHIQCSSEHTDKSLVVRDCCWGLIQRMAAYKLIRQLITSNLTQIRSWELALLLAGCAVYEIGVLKSILWP